MINHDDPRNLVLYTPLKRWWTEYTMSCFDGEGDTLSFIASQSTDVVYVYNRVDKTTKMTFTKSVFDKFAKRDHRPMFWKVMCELVSMPAGRHPGMPEGGVEYQRQLTTLGEMHPC